MEAVLVANNQSVFDVNFQVNGDIENIFDFALLNGISITENLKPAQSLNYTPNNNPVAEYFTGRQYRPATDVTELHLFLDEGIDFWAIDDDFVISET